MVLAQINSDMNSNYENRKHGGYSKIGHMQYKMIKSFPQIGMENIFEYEYYFPYGQKIEPGQLEKLAELKKQAIIELKQSISAYDMTGVKTR